MAPPTSSPITRATARNTTAVTSSSGPARLTVNRGVLSSNGMANEDTAAASSPLHRPAETAAITMASMNSAMALAGPPALSGMDPSAATMGVMRAIMTPRAVTARIGGSASVRIRFTTASR